MKKTLAIVTLALAMSACGPNEKKEEVSQEMIKNTRKVESVTDELEKTTDDLTKQMQETEHMVDSLLNDI